ncbi:2-oxoacid:acceptor oxidoreductase subunit alpha [Candidatus Acetothermia bacterium]|nr:2-oxoacid:acceptor oxidoreductase subunit alpha [Candidatus Acetothermia bacterium]
MSQRTNSLAWLLGGAQYSGVESSVTLFARACAAGGLHIYSQREYYSNIMGEHSYFQVRVDEKPIHSIRSTADLIVSADAETVFIHGRNVNPNGGIIYDSKLVDTPISKVPMMEHQAREEILHYLKSKGLGETVGDMIKDAEKRGVRLYPIPYDELLQKMASGQMIQLAQGRRIANAMAVAASLAVLNYDIKKLEEALTEIFQGKKKIIDLNMKAVEITYDYVRKTFKNDFLVQLVPIATKETRLYVGGNQAVALGKIAAGCTVQTYYPISPATDESTYLEAHGVFPHTREAQDVSGAEKGSILVIQTEDEIAAITMATGATLTGARAATSTSGPGFSLMVEALGWAGINEVPVVVQLYQRGSPSTGLPTRHEQGDLRFVLHAGHGEFPRIVLASGDLEECFYDAMRIFNYAERYQTPAIHLLDKALASSSQTLAPFRSEMVKIDRGALLGEREVMAKSSNGGFKRFEYTDSGVSERTGLGTKGGIFWNTGDEHDEYGHIIEDPTVRVQMMEKRAKKLELAAKEIPLSEKMNIFGDPKAETVILSWGSTKGAILDAMEVLKAEGVNVCFVQVRLIQPLPSEELRQAVINAKRRLCIENNFSGQFAGWVREHTGLTMDHLIVKYNGRPMSMDEIVNAVKQSVKGKAPKRIVLTDGE